MSTLCRDIIVDDDALLRLIEIGFGVILKSCFAVLSQLVQSDALILAGSCSVDDILHNL